MNEQTPQGRFDLPPEAAARPVLVDRLARFVLWIFFRRTEVSGLERAPRQGPAVFVGNHINGLIDPALLIAFLPLKPRFLAKSTLWSNPLVRPFLELAAAIPVYRKHDPGVDPSRNAETFKSCHQALAAGSAIAIFPEGRSHNEPALVTLKTGVSRIVLEAERKYGDGPTGGLGVQVVPVGLSFEDKERFRSRVLLQVGRPLDAAAELARYDEDPRGAVRSLTDRIRQGLDEVTLNFPSWEEARLIARAAELYQRPAGELPAELDLERRFDISRAFIDGHQRLKRSAPERIEHLAEKVREYDAQLEACGLSDRQLASTYPPAKVLLFALSSLLVLVLRLPLALIGTVLNALPYRLTRWGAQRFGHTADQVATYKVFGSLLFYPATWLLETLLAGWLGGREWALAIMVLAPLSAYFALRFHQRRGYFTRETRAYLMLRSRRRSFDQLKELRQQILEELEELDRTLRDGELPDRGRSNGEPAPDQPAADSASAAAGGSERTTESGSSGVTSAPHGGTQ